MISVHKLNGQVFIILVEHHGVIHLFIHFLQRVEGPAYLFGMFS